MPRGKVKPRFPRNGPRYGRQPTRQRPPPCRMRRQRPRDRRWRQRRSAGDSAAAWPARQAITPAAYAIPAGDAGMREGRDCRDLRRAPRPRHAREPNDVAIRPESGAGCLSTVPAHLPIPSGNAVAMPLTLNSGMACRERPSRPLYAKLPWQGRYRGRYRGPSYCFDTSPRERRYGASFRHENSRH